jgi:hypothetical protein
MPNLPATQDQPIKTNEYALTITELTTSPPVV